MATVVTYLLVSDPKDPQSVRSHPLLEDHDFETHSAKQEESDALPALRFSTTNALEDRPNLENPCRKLSSNFPEATITLCEVKERFDQVEHLRSVVFMDGKRAGEIEHGYVLNVGT